MLLLYDDVVACARSRPGLATRVRVTGTAGSSHSCPSRLALSLRSNQTMPVTSPSPAVETAGPGTGASVDPVGTAGLGRTTVPSSGTTGAGADAVGSTVGSPIGPAAGTGLGLLLGPWLGVGLAL